MIDPKALPGGGWRWLLLALGLLIPAALYMANRQVGSTDPVPPKNPPVASPVEELTDPRAIAERDAAVEAENRRRQEAFLSEVLPGLQLDLSTVTRSPTTALFARPYPTVEAAARAADLIVRVRITEVTFRTDYDAATTAAEVVEYWKGSGAGTVMFVQYGTVVQMPPDYAAKYGVPYMLLETEAKPFLIPGDEAVLFLSRPQPPEFPLAGIIPYTGWFKLTEGRLEAAPSAPASARLYDGGAEADLRRDVQSFLAVE